MQASFSHNDTLSTNNFFGFLCVTDLYRSDDYVCVIFGRLLVTLTYTHTHTQMQMQTQTQSGSRCSATMPSFYPRVIIIIIIIIIIVVITAVIDGGINVLPSDIAKHF